MVTAPPCEAHRATSKDVRATVHSSKSNMGLRKMHKRGPPQSACPAHAGNLVLKREENKFFGKLRWLEHRRKDRAIHWFFFNKFRATLTLWILSEHSKPQPAWCALPLLLYSTQHLHPFTGRNNCGHSPFLMRTSSWMACARSCQPMAYLARAEGVSFKADGMEDLASKKVELGRNRKRIDNLPIGQVQCRWFFSSISNLLLRLLSEFS